MKIKIVNCNVTNTANTLFKRLSQNILENNELK